MRVIKADVVVPVQVTYETEIGEMTDVLYVNMSEGLVRHRDGTHLDPAIGAQILSSLGSVDEGPSVSGLMKQIWETQKEFKNYGGK